jgi:pyrroloquinoline quinone biosynthesis protein E
MYYKVNENMIVRREYFGGIVFDVDEYRNAAYFVVDGKAIDILEMIESGLSEEKIKSTMRKIHGEEGASEMTEIIKQALDNKIVRTETSAKQHRFNFEEFMENRERISKLKRLNAPIIVSLNPTLKCNQLCDFCYVNVDWKGVYQDRLSLDDWKNLIDQLVKYKIPLIDIVGGEPFVWKDMVNLLEYIKTKPINYIMSTNGTLITEELAKRLSKLDRKRFYLNVSLEDFDEERHDIVVKKKGAYKALMRSLGYLKENNVNFGINTVVNERNLDRIEKLYELLKSMGVPQFTVSFFHAEYDYLPDTNKEIGISKFYKVYQRINELNEKDNKKMLLSKEGPFLWLCSDKMKITLSETPFVYLNEAKLPPKDPFGLDFCECQMGKSRLDVLPDGSVFPCILLTNRSEFLVGKYPRNDIHELWHNKAMERISSYLPIKKEPCSNCKFLEACKGGCFAYMLNKHDKKGYPDARCPIVQGYYNGQK